MPYVEPDYFNPALAEHWLRVLFQGCYQSAAVLEFAFNNVPTTGLMSVIVMRKEHLALYESMRVFWHDHHMTPSDVAFQPYISGFMARLVPAGDPDAKRAYEALQEIHAVALSQPLATEKVSIPLNMLAACHKRAYVDPAYYAALQDGMKSTTLDGTLKELAKIKAIEKTAKISANPFDLAGTIGGDFFPTGLPWLDTRFGGGLCLGDSYTLLAPTGGGKTTLAIQLSCSLTAIGKRVLYILTEQTFKESKLVYKFWAAATGQPWTEFAKYKHQSEFPPELVSPEARESIMGLQSRLFCHDPSTIRSLSDIEAVTIQRKPDLVIVDWAGYLAQTLMETPGNAFDGDRRQCLRSVADTMTSIAKRHGVATLTLQQLSPQFGLNPFTDFNHTMAHECKDFSQSASFAGVLCPKDENSNLRLVVTKTRFGEAGSTILHLNGLCSRFEELQGYRKGPNKLWMPPSKNDNRHMPGKDEKKGDGFA
jgi:RecA/RadA recombinase